MTRMWLFLSFQCAAFEFALATYAFVALIFWLLSMASLCFWPVSPGDEL